MHTEEAMEVQSSTSGPTTARAPAPNTLSAKVTPRIQHMTDDAEDSYVIAIEGPFNGTIEGSSYRLANWM
jgi:hypothetical protein